ncbi:single-stranded DNA-binding protein [Nakamurella silvestris]|nr:single-stranded DNA-binding protein [Nakamurella silvestris]
MGSAVVQVFGNVVAHPKISTEHEGRERVSLRVVATERKRDPDTGTWSDGDEFGVNVVCWRALARGVSRSIFRGDPVVVIGRISTRYYQAEGEQRSTTEIRATHVGHDLSRGTASFKRFARSEQGAGQDLESVDASVDGLARVVSEDPGLIADDQLPLGLVEPEPDLASAPW